MTDAGEAESGLHNRILSSHFMPPKRGRGIVKSGNAGNSSKASKVPPKPAPEGQEEKKSLFPPGYKYPLTILNER